MLDLFMRGFLTEHMVLSQGLGLIIFAFLSYNFREAFHTALRFSLFFSLLVGIGLAARPLFNEPLFFVPFLAGIHGLLMLLLNLLLPQTIGRSSFEGLIKRGDAFVFLCTAAVLDKNLSLVPSLIFTLGGILGTCILLIIMAALWETFNLHRQGVLRAAAWRMAVLAILSFLIS